MSAGSLGGSLRRAALLERQVSRPLRVAAQVTSPPPVARQSAPELDSEVRLRMLGADAE